ncbi:MAG: DUF4197 domain-containing protein [Novosphingobium sp.]|nr:DUF4197 domain-containing protein [Novosphingobium sp.]
MGDNSAAKFQRRKVLGAAASLTVLAVAGCATTSGYRPYSYADAVRRLLQYAANAAFARLTAPGGFWDSQVTRLALPDLFGRRGGALQNVLTSALFHERLQRALNIIAEGGARRAAPLVIETIRTIGLPNAVALIHGDPRGATAYLREAMGGRLIEVMIPQLDEGLHVARDPLVGEVLAALTGVDVPRVARSLAVEVDDAIWDEIARQEAGIRADPQATGDALLARVLGRE